MKKTILVTGAGGFVGGHIALDLASAGFQVRASDQHQQEAQLAHRFAGARNITLMTGDITDQDDCRRLTEQVNGVMHCAGISRVSLAQRDPARCFDINVRGTVNLLDALRRSTLDAGLILMSTREVERIAHPSPRGCQAEDAYALSKKLAEEAAQSYAHEQQRGGLIYRLSDVYGSQFDHPGKLLPTLLSQALAQQPLHLNSPQHRCYYTHIDDVSAALVTGMQALCEQPRLRDLRRMWSGNGLTSYELAQLILEKTASQSTLVLAPDTASLPHNVNTGTHLRSTGWSFMPTVNIARGIERLIELHRVRAA